MRKFQICLAVCVCLASFAKQSHAAIITFDFTDLEVFGDLNRQTAFGPITMGGFEISFAASGRMTTNARDRRGCVSGAGTVQNLVCDGDGIGVGNDEITANRDWLTVRLNWSGNYRIMGIEFLDLFAPEGGQPEYAQYDINGGGINDVAAQSLTGGYVYEPVGLILTGLTTIDFFTTLNRRSDFALARISVETDDRRIVNEPSVLAILSLGLLIAGVFLRRRAK